MHQVALIFQTDDKRDYTVTLSNQYNYPKVGDTVIHRCVSGTVICVVFEYESDFINVYIKY